MTPGNEAETRPQATPGRTVLASIWPGLVLIAAGTVGFLLLLDAVYDRDGLSSVDDPLLSWMVAQRSPALTDTLTVITTVFGPYVLPVIVAAGCAIWGWRTHTWWEPALLAGAMILSTLISSALKVLVARPRPPTESMMIPGLETTFSFPSGHAIGSATLVLVGGYLIWHRHHSGRVLAIWVVISLLVYGTVAVSRLYLGYHFLTDVLAGLALAICVLGVVVIVSRLHNRHAGISTRVATHHPQSTA